MKRCKALSFFLLGTIGQILIVCLAVYLLRISGMTVNYTSLLGLIAISIGGISSALWGIIMSIKYRNISFRTILYDIFKLNHYRKVSPKGEVFNPMLQTIKQYYKNYLLALLFIFLDFLSVIFGGRIEINAWFIPVLMFLKHIVFGGIEEIGWRYFFQPVLQERINYVLATIITFIAWGTWHFLYFFIEGTLSDVNILPFLIGLLTNSFILSALYMKTKNLWLCIMTHSLINVCSQLFLDGNVYVAYVCKVLIIVLAIVIAYSSKKESKD